MNLNNVFKVAIIGAGAQGTKSHIPCLLNNPYTTIEAVVDVDIMKAKKVANKFAIRNCFSSTDELLDSCNVDAVSICSPPDTHAEIAIKALDKGVHVFCEKPLADSVENGLRMVKAADNSERILMIDFDRRFHPNYRKAKYIVEKGLMGRVYCVEYCSMQSSPLLGWSKSSWFYRPGLGGSLMDQGPHVFDMLNWFMGRANSVYISAGGHLDSQVDEFCIATLEYEKGGLGVGTMSWLSSRRCESLAIHGTGRIFYSSPYFTLDVNPTDLIEISLWKSSTSTLVNKISKVFFRGKEVDTYQLAFDYFIHCLRMGRKPYLDGKVGLDSLVITEAALDSLHKKKAVNVTYPDL